MHKKIPFQQIELYFQLKYNLDENISFSDRIATAYASKNPCFCLTYFCFSDGAQLEGKLTPTGLHRNYKLFICIHT